MTELSALNIKITGDAGDLTAATNSAVAGLQKVGSAADATSVRTGALAGSLGRAGKAGTSSGLAMRGVAQQLSQVGQQTMATGQFVQALAIQLPDIGIGFGALGGAIGLVAGIALPMLMSAFGGASEKAAALAAATKGLTDATEAFRITAAAIMLGVDEAEVLNAEELNRLLGERLALTNEMAAASGKALIPLGLELKAINAQIAAQEEKLNAYRAQRDETKALVAEQEKSKGAMSALLAMAPKGGWLAGAISDASLLAGELWGAAEAAAAAVSARDRLGQMAVEFSPGGQALMAYGSRGGNAAQDALADRNAPVADMGGGGGGGGGSPMLAELESVQSSLMSQEALQLESYTRQQEQLALFLEQKLITQQEYAAMSEASQQQHSDAMSAIDVYRYGDGLQKAEAFFGDMSSALAGGNEKMMKISKAFGAAEALINAWRAYAQALATPGINPLQKFALAAKVLAAGMGAVNAIKGGGGGGGGKSSAAGGGGGGAVSPTQTLNFTVTNDPFGFGERIVRQIATQLNESRRNGSNIIASVR
jgi:hypothetical protein